MTQVQIRTTENYVPHDLLVKIVRFFVSQNVDEMTMCSPNNDFVTNPHDINSLISCNIVRGKMLKLRRLEDNEEYMTIDVSEFYSHTATDCPDCNPEEIQKLDEESEMPIALALYDKKTKKVFVFWILSCW